jgi:dTMP kinase
MCEITEMMLFASSRAQHLHEKIIPALNSGKTVISDRFDSATISFQHYARGMDLTLINQINDFAVKGFKPNLTIILDIDPILGSERILKRGHGIYRMEDEEPDFYEKARKGYLIQAKQS